MGKFKDMATDPNMKAMEEKATIINIAINRSWIWMQEYDPHTGQVGTKDAPYINECRRAFIDGFLEGFQARFFEQNDNGVE
jgi:hypothetical protein